MENDSFQKRGVRPYITILKKTVFTFIVFLISVSVSISAYAADIPEKVLALGRAAGISVSCTGLMVSDVMELQRGTETVSPAKDAGILPGDIILSVNNTQINSIDDLQSIINSDGNAIFTVDRCGKTLNICVTPYRNNNGYYEVGLMLRNSLSGIGTITYYDPETQKYGALGHPISDTQSGSVIPIGGGALMDASIVDVICGTPGTPGQLNGIFNINDTIGTIEKNTDCGIFGTLQKPLVSDSDLIEVGKKTEIKTGPAFILSNVAGKQVSEYTIEISRVYSGFEADGRDMMITVTDPDLITATGGIVQGMSGSPIIQNGKLIGAVTHVLVNNPQKGYGISIEAMFDAAA